MYNDILSIGDKIEMVRIYEREHIEHEEVQYISQLLDFVEGKKINIAMPIEKGRIIPIDLGTKYNLCFYTKFGLYQGKCIVTDRYRANNVYIAVVQFFTDLEKFQRRQYYRLECLIDIAYRVITVPELMDMVKLKKDTFVDGYEKQQLLDRLDNYDIEYASAILIDISGGGAKFNSSRAQAIKERLLLKVPLTMQNGIKTLRLYATVVMTEKVLNRSNTYEHRVEFSGISKEDREFIVKFIFDEERKRRRQGK